MNELIKHLRKGLDNRRGKKKEDICETLLGFNGKVWEFAKFYEQHEEDLLVFVAMTLHKWEAEKSFSKEELEIYRLGLTELPLFFGKCVTERDRKANEEFESQQVPQS